jgi:hypothetical protein
MTPETPGERLVRLEGDVAYLKAFVPRVEVLETTVLKFIEKHEAQEEIREVTDKRRARIHFALLGGLITLIAGCAIALFTWILQGHHVVVKTDAPPTSASYDAKIPKLR